MKIPVYEQQTVPPEMRPQYDRYTSTDAGAVAQGVAQLGQGLNQASDDLFRMEQVREARRAHLEAAQKQADTTVAEDRESQLLTAANVLLDKKTGYLSRQGTDALSSYDQTLQAIEKEDQKILGTLQSPAQRQIYETKRTPHLLRFRELVSEHAAHEQKVVEAGTAIARQKALEGNAFRAGASGYETGIEQIGGLVEEASKSAAEAAARLSKSDDERDAMRRTAASGVVQAGIMGVLETGQWAYALTLLKARAELLSPEEYKKLDDEIVKTRFKLESMVVKDAYDEALALINQSGPQAKIPPRIMQVLNDPTMPGAAEAFNDLRQKIKSEITWRRSQEGYLDKNSPKVLEPILKFQTLLGTHGREIASMPYEQVYETLIRNLPKAYQPEAIDRYTKLVQEGAKQVNYEKVVVDMGQANSLFPKVNSGSIKVADPATWGDKKFSLFSTAMQEAKTWDDDWRAHHNDQAIPVEELQRRLTPIFAAKGSVSRFPFDSKERYLEALTAGEEGQWQAEGGGPPPLRASDRAEIVRVLKNKIRHRPITDDDVEALHQMQWRVKKQTPPKSEEEPLKASGKKNEGRLDNGMLRGFNGR